MIDKKLVQHVAHLAKLEFDDAQLDKFTKQLDEIITMEDELAQVDTTGVQPTTHISRQKTSFRADEVQPNNSREELLQNVPEQQDGLIKVPAILDNEEE
ncbi:Asp-tRNA(Asn)/Glu-tRNA(Gln) amidotransferase GatCAB subunit C [Bombilactobacillus bombi]|uniref:Aspartyl/glutamyl-tRNA(Asn/Gln) amidotransferase subunit C n=1 Tax=Bombilactobacillus bombi TaxID=1303590 RepID=A0A417Z383_9LACO|nr:Asp-tRNA(Asn)/Glu-tRNA(Gln) amidotransferase subunit GatC [Bombilactobacillus bombi]RHW45124.1 Asp-tRNA(Asn)/Glu-tRNA(Gln) amidotransferase GatCAB subunit C [Bombilactobacillus bombi]